MNTFIELIEEHNTEGLVSHLQSFNSIVSIKDNFSNSLIHASVIYSNTAALGLLVAHVRLT